ncbi:hypothetical protein N7481_012550 [Penicillium waksmanii]|uniref:uncharacterized protein n=1 Tax=Penicillium waksmanii TaxID=69791 RepID=UPI002548CE0D|nr:uncharacterized protein N7481_012550 [Penicillium waksmanii]KAJ5965836.1 hypothetical protein N7481_012550 [Penicillium waksmanii]
MMTRERMELTGSLGVEIREGTLHSPLRMRRMEKMSDGRISLGSLSTTVLFEDEDEDEDEDEEEQNDYSYSSKSNTDPTLIDAELLPELLPDTSWELSEVKVEALGTWE